MKHSVRVLAVLLLLVPLAVMGGQDKMKSSKKGGKSAAKEMTLQGEVVDVSCYLAHGEKGMGSDHMSCAEACAKAGGPLGILTKEKKLYVSVLPDDHSGGPNAKLMDHVGHQVKAKGIVRSQGGVNGIMITSVEMEEAEGAK